MKMSYLKSETYRETIYLRLRMSIHIQRALKRVAPTDIIGVKKKNVMIVLT